MAQATEKNALWPWIAVGGAILTLMAFVYAPVLDFPFVNSDDPTYVTNNPWVLDGLSWANVKWAFTTNHPPYWHPLTWLSHMLDVQLFGGENAGAQHGMNVLLHGANVLLLFGLLLRMTGAPGRSAFVAALFALHPLRVESVAWIAERKDVLSTLFWILTTWAYVVYAKASPGRARILAYAAVLAFYAMGLMSKPMLVSLPFALLLLDYWPLGRVRWGTSEPAARSATRKTRRGKGAEGGTARKAGGSELVGLMLEKLPLLALAAFASLITVTRQTQVGAVDRLPMFLRVANALHSYSMYVRDLFWPAKLAAIYPYPRSYPPLVVLAAILLLGVVTLLALQWLRARPWFAVGWFWYLGTLLPVIGLIQVGPQSRADRFTYVPHIGLYVMLAWGITELVRGRLGERARWVLAPAAVVASLACAMVARAQVMTWESSIALWERSLEATPDNGVGHYNLGIMLMGSGREDEALPHLREAVRLLPAYGLAHNRLAIVLAQRGELEEAREHFQAAAELTPMDPEAHYNVGRVLAELGRPEEAVRALDETLRLNPNHGGARQLLEEITGPRQP